MSKCRTCKREKGKGDICTNPDCERAQSPAYRITNKLQQPLTMMTQHGFHEACTTSMDYVPAIGIFDMQPTPKPVPAVVDNPPMFLDGERLRQWQIDSDRRIVADSTRTWWESAHAQNTLHHQQFPGYCYLCLDQNAGS